MCRLSSLSHIPRAIGGLSPTYLVTGILHSGRRVRITTTDRHHAFTIPLFRGTVWQFIDGKRTALKRLRKAEDSR